MHVFPNLGLILIYSLDHCQLVEDIINVEQGCGCRFERIEKSVVGFAKVAPEAFVALIDITRLYAVILQNRTRAKFFVN